MVKTNNISFSYEEFENQNELGSDNLELILAAKGAASNAYAPYSKFRVGAAVRLESGKIVLGTNVENAAFPSGICAERNAVANSVCNHPGDKITSIAIAAFTEAGLTTGMISPCGNCRQVLAEEESRNSNKIKLILASKDKVLVIDSVNQLLPLQFDKSSLKVILP